MKLALTILDVSWQSIKEYQELIHDSFGKDPDDAMDRKVKVQYEFVFFFAHLAIRNAFFNLGEDKITKLQNKLGPILATFTTEAWFGHWPSKFKKGIESDFYNNINVAEMEYSKCNEYFPKNGEGAKDTLFWEFSKNIAELSGHENNMRIIIMCSHIAAQKWLGMNMGELINAASKEI
jgi:hypothetical protein